METFNELYEKAQSSYGAKIIKILRQLETMHHIFLMNFKILNDFFSFMKDEKKIIELCCIDNREQLDFFHREFIRHIFNFLSSSKAYIDTTREIMKANCNNTPLKTAYDKKIITFFTGSELCGFIQDLRNYHTHFEIPISSTQLRISTIPTQEEFNFKIFVEKKVLLEWSGWKSRAKHYLADAPEKIDFEVICTEYFNLVSEFYQWLYNEISNYFQKDIS